MQSADAKEMRMKREYRFGPALLAALVLTGAGVLIAGQAAVSPAGSWKTIDDKTGKDRSVVRIDIAGGVLKGRVEKSLDPNDKPDATCTKCKGERKDQPILGMEILWGLKSDGDERHWSGGEILDPDNGQTYRAKLTVSQDGKTMEVRGFIGVSLFGRSQTWIRIP
jgi:uncharacterized protein (DUF2147 family)